jgi:hypothetical protein
MLLERFGNSLVYLERFARLGFPPNLLAVARPETPASSLRPSNKEGGDTGCEGFSGYIVWSTVKWLGQPNLQRSNNRAIIESEAGGTWPVTGLIKQFWW